MADYSSIRSSVEPPARLLDTLQTRLPGALIENIQLELTNVLHDFLEQTKSWWEIVDINVKAGKSTYILNPVDNDVDVNVVINITRDGYNTVGWWSQEPGTIVLTETPTVDGTTPLKAVVSLQLREGSRNVPKYIYQHWFETICAGTMANMLGQIGKPYTNERQALVYLKQYRNGRAQARDATRRSWSQGQPPWRFPSHTMAATGNQRGRLSEW